MENEKLTDTNRKTNDKIKVAVEKENARRQTIMEKKSDVEIWRAFKQGNEGAFNYIYHTHFRSLYNFACQLHADHEVVKDLLQDLFIDIRSKSQQLGDVKYIKAYLFRSIKRRVQDYERRLKKSQRVPQQEFEIIFSAESQLINKQLDEDKKMFLAKAMNSLTKRQREVVFYYFYEGMSYEEIGNVLEISNVKSVRNLIYRALNVMRKKSSGFDKILFTLI